MWDDHEEEMRDIRDRRKLAEDRRLARKIAAENAPHFKPFFNENGFLVIDLRNPSLAREELNKLLYG